MPTTTTTTTTNTDTSNQQHISKQTDRQTVAGCEKINECAKVLLNSSTTASAADKLFKWQQRPSSPHNQLRLLSF